jgi:hypothetical protein
MLRMTPEELTHVQARIARSTKDMRDTLEKGVPPEVVMGGDPVEIGFYERIAAAQTQGRLFA